MGNTVFFNQGAHKNVLLEDFGHGLAVQANQHVIIHNGEAIILDPGGHKVFAKAMSALRNILDGGKLRYIFLSHQDPDIVAATNGWLMTTDADAYVSRLWTRFVPHFGVDRFVQDRLVSIPDEGMKLDLNGCELLVIPSHFMHSPGFFTVYDPVSKIAYTGDIGASIGHDYAFVPDFESHEPSVKGFHQRYMSSTAAAKLWAGLMRQLDIEIIAPQHGAAFKGKELVNAFLTWCENTPCGVDVLQNVYKIPT